MKKFVSFIWSAHLHTKAHNNRHVDFSRNVEDGFEQKTRPIDKLKPKYVKTPLK